MMGLPRRAHCQQASMLLGAVDTAVRCPIVASAWAAGDRPSETSGTMSNPMLTAKYDMKALRDAASPHRSRRRRDRGPRGEERAAVARRRRFVTPPPPQEGARGDRQRPEAGPHETQGRGSRAETRAGGRRGPRAPSGRGSSGAAADRAPPERRRRAGVSDEDDLHDDIGNLDLQELKGDVPTIEVELVAARASDAARARGPDGALPAQMALFESTGMCTDDASKATCATLAKETAARLVKLAELNSS